MSFTSTVIALFVLTLMLLSCSNNLKNKCDNFYKTYPDLVSDNTKSGDTTLLLSTLDKIISKSPKCVDALLTRADLYYLIDSLNFAIVDFEKVRFLDTNNVYCFYKLALCYQLKENFELAVYYSDLAINKKKHGEALIDYFQTPVQTKDDKSRYDVSSSELLFDQGVSYFNLGKLQSAYNNFNFCIAGNYTLEWSYLYRGAILVQSNQVVKGCQDFAEAKKLGNIQVESYIAKYCNLKKK